MPEANKHILLTTLGVSWPIVPELIGFLLPKPYPLFRSNSSLPGFQQTCHELGISQLDECWIIATGGDGVGELIAKIEKWKELSRLNGLRFCFFYANGIDDLKSEADCRAMGDLIMRAVLHAREQTREGKLILSLTGGRKTMSTDMFRAAGFFGCDLLIHLADAGFLPNALRGDPKPDEIPINLNQTDAQSVFPVVVAKDMPSNPLTEIPDPVSSLNFPLGEKEGNPVSTALIDQIEYRMTQAGNIQFNAYFNRTKEGVPSGFYMMQQLHPTLISRLQNSFIGADIANFDAECKLLQSFPKAELHCHLGGILNPAELIDTAISLSEEICLQLKNNENFAAWHQQVKNAIVRADLNFLKQFTGRALRAKFPEIQEPLTIAAFIAAFDGFPGLFKELIYGSDQCNSLNLKEIGFDAYERLGDYQGSSLLQHEKTLRKALSILKNNCALQNIKYLELRCSPGKYVRGNLNAMQVVSIIKSELEDCKHTQFKIIIIGSRHAGADELKDHVQLMLDLSAMSDFSSFLAGFDIAGDETAASPSEMRSKLETLLKKCIRFTIHAGETMSPESIWEAVYYLNADRIGHGLTLPDKPELYPHFTDRRVFIELCPSSNFQIIGFPLLPGQDVGKVYPLRHFLNNGLKATINTDNPGISLTNLSQEFVIAALLSPGGISRWEMLHLIKNGFACSFLNAGERKQLIINAEKEIFQILTNA